MKTEDALAGDRRRANEEANLPLAGNYDGLGLGRGSSQLHDDDDGRSGGDGHHRVHDNAQLAMVGVGLFGMQVRRLGDGQQRKQDKTEHRHGRQGAGPRPAFPAEKCLKSCQSFLPVFFKRASLSLTL